MSDETDGMYIAPGLPRLKLTKGEWRLCGGGTPAYMAIHSESNGYIVFEMADRNIHTEYGQAISAPDCETQMVNARAIENVPGMLEVCVELIRALDPRTGREVSDVTRQEMEPLRKHALSIIWNIAGQKPSEA